MTDELIRKSDALAACAPLYGWSIAAAEELEASIEALPAVTVGVKPLDLSNVQKHAFLSGVVAARNVPPNNPCSGPLLWLDYDPGDNPALARIEQDAATIARLTEEIVFLRRLSENYSEGEKAAIRADIKAMNEAALRAIGEPRNG